jgi:hypothetical protein
LLRLAVVTLLYNEGMTRPKFTKPDLNQAQIVDELRSLGFDVDVICDLPGLYDLVVSGNKWVQAAQMTIPAVSVRVEVKSKNGTMSDAELVYYNRQKNKNSYILAYCTEDIVHWFRG